jgi:hypothetical protein
LHSDPESIHVVVLQSLRILKNSDLMPYVVFVAPPSLVQLKRWKVNNLGTKPHHHTNL